MAWPEDHWSQFGVESMRHRPELALRWIYTVIQTVIPLAAAAQQALDGWADTQMDSDDRAFEDSQWANDMVDKLTKELADQHVGHMKIHRELVDALATERTKAEQARSSVYNWEHATKEALQAKRRAEREVDHLKDRIQNLQNHLKGLGALYRQEKVQTRGLREILDMLNQKLYHHAPGDWRCQECGGALEHAEQCVTGQRAIAENKEFKP